MLSRLGNIFADTAKASYPSVVLSIEAPSTTTYALHIAPEDGVAEHICYMRPKTTTFSYAGSKERSREQLGTVLLYVGDGETPREFLGEVSAQVTQLLSLRETASGGESRAYAVDQALRSVVLDSLRKRENREPPANAAQMYPIFLVRIERSKPGKIVDDFEPTSISRW